MTDILEPSKAMIAYRERLRLTLKDMSEESGVSEQLLDILENGGTTTTKIAKRVAKAYRLTDEQAELLLPLNLRPNGGDYDPLRYMDQKDIRALSGEPYHGEGFNERPIPRQTDKNEIYEYIRSKKGHKEYEGHPAKP